MPSPPPGPGFRLVVEAALDGVARTTAEGLEVLALGAGVSTVALDQGGAPEILDGDAPAQAGAMFQLEPVELERCPTLVMLAPRSSPVRVNGGPAPPLSLLEVGDVIELGDVLLHVSWQRTPQVGPVAERLVGKPCPVCRTPIEATAICLLHDCGSALHLESEEDGLKCALLGDCASCGRPVSLDEGLSYVPGP